jgi:dihydrodipicolinate synthase/N-acetylneuraminate lyase
MDKKRYPPCILATVVVPWTADWRLDEETFRRHIKALLANGFRNLYIFGTAGEGYAVDDRQFLQVTEVFAEEMRRGGAEPMVGVISLSLSTVIGRLTSAHALGVRQFQVSLPSWGTLDDQEVEAFFAAVLGRFPDCRFLHYNLMRTGRIVTPAQYAALAARYPNLVATKNSTDSMGRIRSLQETAGELQHFFTERGYGYGSLLGECGLLISVGITNYGMGRRYFEAGRSREWETLLRLEGDLSKMTEALIEAIGAEAHMDGAYDKVLAHMHDRRFPLRLLPPYRSADQAVPTHYLSYVREHMPDWLPEEVEESV